MTQGLSLFVPSPNRRRFYISSFAIIFLLGVSWLSAAYLWKPVKAKTVSTSAAPAAMAAPLVGGCASPSFGAASNFGVGNSPGSVAVGDFNGDGWRDLATANLGSSNVSVLLGNGDGSFGAATNFSAGSSTNAVAVGDFNLDGNADLAATNGGSNDVSVLLGNGSGGFGAATNYGVGTLPTAVAVDDFNFDGKPDLVTGHFSSGDVWLLLGDGTGSFSPASSFGVGNGTLSVATGDFNLDGKADLAVSKGGSSNNLSVLLGDGMGSFGAATNYAVGFQPQEVVVGDFNLDGKPDLATAAQNSNHVSVLLGDGLGGFGAATNFAAGLGASPGAIVTGDFNQDGKPDLATANFDSDNVSVLLGNGAGSFATASNFSAGDGAESIAIGDFNQDGKPDLVAANLGSTTVSVLLNTCNGTPCGATGFGTATGFLAGTGPVSVAKADFNRDGRLDLAVANFSSNDVSVLLGNGTGGFGAATNFSTGSGPQSVMAVDLNLDGQPDLVTANFLSDDISVMLGDGLGGFGAAVDFNVGLGPSWVAAGDFNLDGRPDLIIANLNSNTVTFKPGIGNGSLGESVNFGVGTSPASVAVGDFNLDGRSDIAVANVNSGNVSVRLGNGAGNFGAVTNFNVGSDPVSVKAADFNQDGKLDLAVANFASDNVSVLLGNGMGGFGAATNFNVGDDPLDVSVGDFNLDGRLDLAAANSLSDNVSVLLGNGAGSFGAITNFSAGLGPAFVVSGDFNQDGSPDFALANVGDGARPGTSASNRRANERATPAERLAGDGVAVLLNVCYAGAQTITVTTTADTVAVDGQCSLREAIQAANANAQVNECPPGAPGLDAIAFNIGMGAPSIALTSALPDITDSLSIDGATGGATRVELNGAGAGAASTGLRITAGGSTVKSLVINRFTDNGIALQTLGGNTVLDCLIGTDAAGSTSQANVRGINIVDSPNNIIGGLAPGARNIISGNSGPGISITGSGGTGNHIRGNYIGVTLVGNAALGNGQSGIIVGSNSNTIGGATLGMGNIISGNGNDGIVIGSGSGNQVLGNLIGTNALATAAIANAFQGVSLNSTASNTTVGGITAAARNIISGNGINGVRIAVSNNQVLGNYIGANAIGTAIANGAHGVEIAGGSSNTVGGTQAGEGNTIAFNTLTGVAVTGAAFGNNLSGNLVFSNGLLGLDLGNNGVTTNDAGDADTGPNDLQNFPVLSSAVINGSIASIQGSLNSAASTKFRIEFFSNPTCDASGNGEGQVYLGFTNVTTDAGGNVSFSAEFPASLMFGQVVTATATDPGGNTSEFSPCGCSFTLTPAAAGFDFDGGNGTVGVMTSGGCLWMAVSNVPWITVTGGASGSGNGTVSYTVAANALVVPRTGSISIAGFTFSVTQAAAGLILNEDFGNGIPEDWTVVDGGTGDLSWEDDNPCDVTPGPPFVPPFVIVDLTCAPDGVVPDESLITPPFDASGLGRVILQFDSWFKFTPGGLNVIGDVDVSTDGGLNWVNVLRLQGVNENPNTRTLDITSVVSGNPANVRVRFHYYAVGMRPAGPNAPRFQELSWGIDRPTILALSLGPVSSPPIPAAGDSGSVMVTVPDGYSWSAQSDNEWITLAASGGTGRGPLGYTVAPYSGACQRAGSITIELLDTGLTPAPNAAHLVTQLGAGLTINPASLANGFVGVAYSQTLTPGGGTAPYTCLLDSGSLPAGISLSDCALGGTPSVSGTSNFTIRATDNAGCTDTRVYDLTVIGGAGSGLQFYPLATPVRLLDTRSGGGISGCTTGTGAIAASSTRTQPARTVCSGIPANATAVIGNITVVPSASGFLTLFPGDATQPTVANSNFKAGEVTNNFFTVGLDAAEGAFKIFSNAATDVIIDLTGYYAPPSPGGLYYHPLPAPVRLVETRSGQTGCFQPAQLVGANNPNADPSLDLQVQGRGPGLPGACNSIPSDAVVLVGNATTVLPNAPLGFGYLTIYPSDAMRPTVASSNYAANDVINGPFAVKLGADGKFKIYTFATTHLVVDITGYYSASATDVNGQGLLFNPLPKPMRLLETRPDFPSFPLTGCYRPNAPVPGSPAIRTQQVWGTCSDQPITIPNTARAIVGNVTVLNPVNAGFLTFFPGDVGTAPTVATSNYPFPVLFGYNRHYYAGMSPADGTFKMLTQFTTDLIVDVSGYFTP